MLRVSSTPERRAELISTSEAFKGCVVDLAPTWSTFELTGTPEELDAFQELARPRGIQELRPYGTGRHRPRLHEADPPAVGDQLTSSATGLNQSLHTGRQLHRTDTTEEGKQEWRRFSATATLACSTARLR